MFTVGFQSLYLLWEDNRWDGPLSGMCELNGEKLYFNCADEAYSQTKRMYKRIRTFNLYMLPLEQLKAREAQHELFRQYVGEHCDYIDGTTRNYCELKPYSDHGKFYEQRGDFSLNASWIVGTAIEIGEV